MNKCIALALVAGLAAAASADVVAYWAFNNDPLPGGGFGYQPGDFPAGADYGVQAGTATVNVTGGLTGDTTVSAGGDTVYTWIQSFAGSTVNAQFGEPAGGSLAVQGGTDVANNGAIIEVAFNGALYESLNFSFAGRRTSTGFNNVTIAAFDGANFLGNLAAGLDLTTSSTLSLYSFNSSILDGIADARVLLILNGATSATGNVRLDNFLVEGTLIPAPGALALVGLGGLVASRRRR
jgi:hypothetical protein